MTQPLSICVVICLHLGCNGLMPRYQAIMPLPSEISVIFSRGGEERGFQCLNTI